MIGIGLDITRAGQTVSFSPENLRVGTRDVRDLTLRPNRMYSDTAGTTLIAGPSAEVAAMRDSRGVLVATQATAAARPKYAVQPAVGVRNRANGSAAVADAAFWSAAVTHNGVTATKLTNGVTAGGNAWARYQVAGTASGVSVATLYITTQSRTPAAIGQAWTASASVQIESGTTGNAASGMRVLSVEETAPNIFIGLAGNTAFKGASLTPISATRTIASGNQARGAVVAETDNGQAVDYIVYVEALQFEQAASRTAWQSNRSVFDITEAGVRTIDALVPDGMDDFMTLSSPITLGSAYMAAWATDATSRRFLGGPEATIEGFAQIANIFHNVTDGERFRWAGLSTIGGRRVDLINASSLASAQYFRNGVDAGAPEELPTVAMGSLTEIFRRSNAYANGRFFGGVALSAGDTPFTEAERLMTQRYLAYKGGITL